MACVPPAFVVILPVVPAAKAPSMLTASTSGFHVGQVPTSDHSPQTRSGLAVVSSVLPVDAMMPPRSGAGTVARPPAAHVHRTNGGARNRHHDCVPGCAPPSKMVSANTRPCASPAAGGG